MVGVRNSQGCKPCRRKKRGCDKSRPSCGQCQKIGAKCIYEDRSWIFVAPQEYATAMLPYVTRASRNDSSFLITDRRQQLETAFWEGYLPSGESSRKTASTNSVVATWIPTMRYLASQDSIVRLALDSCVLIVLGQMQGSPDFIQHGMAMYGQALAKTNRALQNLATAQTDDTLATCELLAMCERYRPHTGSAVSTQATDYHRHVEGTSRLLKLRGSHRHLHEHGFALFSQARFGIAISGITRRQRQLLDTHQWLQAPWSTQLRPRTLKDKLVDAMLTVAGVLEQLDLCCDMAQMVLKIAGQEHPDRHRPTAGIKQWMAPAVDIQINQLFHTQFHQVMSPGGRYEFHSPLVSRRHLPDPARPRGTTSSP